MHDATAPKPIHLGPRYGAQFSDASIVRAYRYRPPYPNELFATLAELLGPEPAAVLDAGCGSGDLTLGMVRRIAQIVRIDGIDVSQAMVAEGQRRPGGDDPRINWQVAPIEIATLNPPYALITAGESLHWMDWHVVMPRFRAALHSAGVLAIVGRAEQPTEWSDALLAIVRRYSTNRDFQPYNLIDELTTRKLFAVHGWKTTDPVTHTQPIGDYIESWHSRNGLSRDRMTLDAAEAFDSEVRTLLVDLGHYETVTFTVVGIINWGLPDG